MFLSGGSVGFSGHCQNEFLGDVTHFIDDRIHFTLVVYGLFHEVGLFKAQPATYRFP